jgi:hypothetical protein
MKNTFYYFDSNGRPQGPIPHQQLIPLLAKGLAHRSTWIICVESHEWMTVDYAIRNNPECTDLQQIQSTIPQKK